MSKLPILYSFRRCPYAISARLAIRSQGKKVELRSILLKEKPLELLEASAKGTVPVLVLPTGEVIDQSLQIMRWAYRNRILSEMESTWIYRNAHEFKVLLDRYKYASRFPEKSEAEHREEAIEYLNELNNVLEARKYLAGDEWGFLDEAIFPFIRQFSFVNRKWFLSQTFTQLIIWLEEGLKSEAFLSVMEKAPIWRSL